MERISHENVRWTRHATSGWFGHVQTKTCLEEHQQTYRCRERNDGRWCKKRIKRTEEDEEDESNEANQEVPEPPRNTGRSR